jgi:dTDP-L-rhamnose 4-epimerase
MKALVTGGAGLIGSHIVDMLIESGHQVRILDNLNKPTHLHGCPDWVHPDSEFVFGDVRDREDLDKALDDIDWVFHQAADGGFTNEISHYFSNNAMPTTVLYELIRDKHPVKKVVTASSQAVYGEGKYLCENHGPQYPLPRTLDQFLVKDWDLHCPICDQHMVGMPIDEDYVNPQMPYAMSKYMNEILAINLGRLYDIPTVALRYSLTYGPRQSLFNPYTGICSIFSTRILNNKSPVVYEDGLQTRDFIFVGDVARANLHVAQDARADYQVYNVGTGVATTILEFVSTLAKEYGKDISAEMRGEFRPGDFRHLSSDASRLRDLGWEPNVPINEGLACYASWIKGFSKIEDYFSKAETYLKNTRVVLQS